MTLLVRSRVLAMLVGRVTVFLARTTTNARLICIVVIFRQRVQTTLGRSHVLVTPVGRAVVLDVRSPMNAYCLLITAMPTQPALILMARSRVHVTLVGPATVLDVRTTTNVRLTRTPVIRMQHAQTTLGRLPVLAILGSRAMV